MCNYPFYLTNNVYIFEEHIILNNEDKIKVIYKEIKNNHIFFSRVASLSSSEYFQSEKIEIKSFSRLFEAKILKDRGFVELLNSSSLKEFSNLGYSWGNEYYYLLFKPLSYETQHLYSYEIHKSNCISIDDYGWFKDSIKFGYCKSDHLSYKEVFGNINHIERIKYIALILQHAGFLFEIISLDDFILNPVLGLCLSRYRHIKQFDKKVPHILRCPKCHSSMELDLEPFRKVLLRTMEAHYSCPKCKASNSYTKMLKTYETNIRNSYKQGGIL